MVKNLDKHVINTAILEAEKTTNAKLSVIVAPASDAYQSYALIYGLTLGSVISIVLWASNLDLEFPLLLVTQIVITSIAAFTPWLRPLLTRLVPKRVRHHRASHRAFEEYLFVSRHADAKHPLVLLYISLAERYAHILTSRTVRDKIPDSEWDAVIATLTNSMPKQGLQTSCLEAVKHAALLLSAQFPKN